jgi:hypothetical protein
MQVYLKKTRELQNEGKYTEALERHIWFYNNALQYQKSMSGVRNSFALSDWKKLGEVYPPAKKALLEIRDTKTKEIAANGGSTELFQDVSAINRTLGRESETIQLFEGLMKTSPELAKRSWIIVKDATFAAKRYDIIQQYIGNPIREFTVIEEHYKRITASTARFTTGKESMKAYNENSFVEKTLQLIDFAIVNKDTKSAKEIKEKALAVVKDYRLEKLVI